MSCFTCQPLGSISENLSLVLLYSARVVVAPSTGAAVVVGVLLGETEALADESGSGEVAEEWEVFLLDNP